MKKFYEFKNITNLSADIYIYGEIVQEASTDWWTGEKSETDVALMNFKKQLDDIGNVSTLNLYINSPGGDVFVASAMISMLERVKANGTTINAYVDGLSASAASFLMFVANNIYLYKNSVVMVHKPMSWAFGNANDMQKTIDMLNKIEDSTLIPMYMKKAKITEDEVKELVNAESWLSATDMDNYFEVTVLEEEKNAVASVSKELFSKYKNVPDSIKNALNIKNTVHTEKASLDLEEKDITSESNKQSSEEEKDKQIKAKLNIIKGSLIVKKMKVRRNENEIKSNCRTKSNVK